MGVASGCGEQEVGVASGSGWNLWVWLLGVVVRRYGRRQKKVPRSIRTTGARLKKTGGEQKLNGN